MSPSVTWGEGGGSKKCQKIVKYYLNGTLTTKKKKKKLLIFSLTFSDVAVNYFLTGSVAKATEQILFIVKI
jgi:hypothetical protein